MKLTVTRDGYRVDYCFEREGGEVVSSSFRASPEFAQACVALPDLIKAVERSRAVLAEVVALGLLAEDDLSDSLALEACEKALKTLVGE